MVYSMKKDTNLCDIVTISIPHKPGLKYLSHLSDFVKIYVNSDYSVYN
jgi:hypothetical protein